MRVTLVFPGCGRQGGVERVMWEAATHLAGRHDVTVVSRWAEDLPTGVTHLPVPESPKSGTRAALDFRREAKNLLRSSSPDVVVSYGSQCPQADLYVVGSVHRAWLRQAGPFQVVGRPVPGWARFALPRTLAALWLERSYYRAARGRWLVPCSEQVARDLDSIYGLEGCPRTVVHNGFSPKQFSPERRRAQRREARRELGYGCDEVVLLMVANEWQRKGLSVVLAAMERVNDPRLRLLLVGRTPPDVLLARLDRQWRERVSYLGSSTDVARQHAAADLFVLPTQYEAFCLAIVEALASGLPVLTSDVPGAADTVQPGVNGLVLADPLDAAGLAGLLSQAMDAATRAAWSEQAPATVQEYRWDVLMTRFEEVLVEAKRAPVFTTGRAWRPEQPTT